MKFGRTITLGQRIAILLTILFAIGRLTIDTRHHLPTWNLSYEAMAHIFIGVLAGLGMASGSWVYWWSLILLTLWEVVCFMLAP